MAHWLVHLPCIEVDGSSLALHRGQILCVLRWLTLAFNISLHAFSASGCFTSPISPMVLILVVPFPYTCCNCIHGQQSLEECNRLVLPKCQFFFPKSHFRRATLVTSNDILFPFSSCHKFRLHLSGTLMSTLTLSKILFLSNSWRGIEEVMSSNSKLDTVIFLDDSLIVLVFFNSTFIL